MKKTHFDFRNGAIYEVKGRHFYFSGISRKMFTQINGGYKWLLEAIKTAPEADSFVVELNLYNKKEISSKSFEARVELKVIAETTVSNKLYKRTLKAANLFGGHMDIEESIGYDGGIEYTNMVYVGDARPTLYWIDEGPTKYTYHCETYY